MDEYPDDELRRFIREFLEDFKALVYEDGLYVQARVINRDHLLELGLTERQRETVGLNIPRVIAFRKGREKWERQ